MVGDELAQRRAHFKRDYLLWIVLRHFLSADLLEELSDAVVDVASDGRIRFVTLFHKRASGGPPALASWAIQTVPTSMPFESYLQDLVRSFVWQNDRSPGYLGHDVSPTEAATIKAIEKALALSHGDLTSVGSSQFAQSMPEPLQALASSIVNLRSLAHPATPEALDAIVQVAISGVDKLPSAVLVKHLGDLCGDVDRWDVAAILYAHAETILSAVNDPAWCAFVSALHTIILQSRAAAARITDSATTARILLSNAIEIADMRTDLLAPVNAIPDFLSAAYTSEESWSSPDTRVSVLFAPQLLDAHNLSTALRSSADQDYSDTYRWFWAVLRRQIALGSATYSRHTKGYYGRCIIDSLVQQKMERRGPATFWDGVRLLIESGEPKIADQTIWPENLIDTFVNVEAVTLAIDHTRRARGVIRERTAVAFAIFNRWIQALPPDNLATAEVMLKFVALSAKKSDRYFFTNLNMVISSLDVLKEVGGSRPEFKTLVADAVADAVAAQLSDGGVNQIARALETINVYVDVLNDQALRSVITATLRLLDRLGAGNGPWHVVRPAIEFLSSEPVMLLCGHDTALGLTVKSTLLRVSLETETENVSLMFLLRDVDPASIKEQVDVTRLEKVISDLRRRAQQINSTAATSNIEALLVAPAVAGIDGVRDAINGLLSILESAAIGEPSISFSYAYRSVMMLTGRQEELARCLSIPEVEVAIMIRPVLDKLFQVWQKASEKPLIFTGFAIPLPTAPNSTLVHNWTFASIGLARSLGQELAMTAAMAAAARKPSLETPMAVARAIRVTAGDPETFDPDSIRKEGRQAFYSALGQRLVLLGDLPLNLRASIITFLLEQCFRLGPRGVDAGVFAAALGLGIQSEALSPAARAYRQRLDIDPELRLSLAPLFERLKPL